MNPTSQQRAMSQLFRYLKRYRMHMSASVIMSILNKVFDLMPPLLVGWMVAVLSHQTPAWMAAIIPAHSMLYYAGFLGVMVIVIFGVESLSEWGMSYGFMTLAQRAQHDLRMDSYKQIQSREIAFFESHRLGDTMTMLNDDVNQLERFLNTGLNELIQLGTLVVFACFVLFTTSWQLAVIGLVPVPIIIFGSLLFQSRMSPKYLKVRETVSNLSARLENNLSGITVIKSFTAEKFEAARVEQASMEYQKANYHAIKLSAAFIPIIRMAIAVGFAAVVFMGSYWVLKGSSIVTISGLVVFTMLIQRILWPMTRLGQTLDNFARARASAKRTFGLLHSSSNIQDPKNPKQLTHVQGQLTFEHVKFDYFPESPILKDLDFTVKAGESVGIAGYTGAGKSTIIKLLLRLYDVKGGKITLDGIDIRDLTLHDLRKQIALVSQDVYLFQGTIHENIAYGLENASLDDVKKAAKLAHMHEFIETLPQGYDTLVGERGVKLSGGQRQRLSIARAILKDAPIIILDEATSSVDTETERTIQQNLKQLIEGKTALIIAHRLSTIRDADRIFVLRDGQLAEQGHHDDLLAAKGAYADLWAMQVGEPVV